MASAKKIGGGRPRFVEGYFEGLETDGRSGSLKKTGKEAVNVSAETVGKDLEYPVFTILKASEYAAFTFYELYLQVMDRAAVKLEVLNRSFFENFFEAMEAEIRILAMVYRGEVLGVFVLALVEDELTFIWTGKEAARDKYDTYFNLMNAMMCYALDQGCERLILGQTSFYAKQRIGGIVEDLFLYFKCHQGWKHWILEKLNAQLFPRLELPELRVFKDDPEPES